MEIKGKTALVTGSARRIGKAIALALAERGAHIAVHYRTSSQEATQTVQELRKLGVKAAAVKADLSRSGNAQKMIQETIRRFGKLDILVNSASAYIKTPLGKIKDEDWDVILDANLKGAFFASQEASRTMLKQKQGKIINLIDSEIRHPYAGYLPYLVSKAGLAEMTRCLAIELAPHIQVNAVSPGPILLPEQWGPEIRRKIIQGTPLKRIGDPEDIARAVLFCVEGTDFMTGAVIPVDGGQHLS